MVDLGTLNLVQVWLEGDHLVSTAKILLKGHRVPALGIVDKDRHLVGLVNSICLELAPDTSQVSKVMIPVDETIQKSVTVRDAAKKILEVDADYLPVLDGSKFYGILTTRSLIGKLRESWDPMTDLPWSDALRDWGIARLKQGIEIAVIFIDLNDFGKFNKQYGHVIGDKVLQRLASHLKSHCESVKDIVVRYGGDEFAIGTVRDFEQAEELVKDLMNGGTGLTIPEIDRTIYFSVGIGGGRRAIVRDDIHGPSNVDDLVTMASQSCLANKPTLPAKSVPAAPKVEELPESTVQVQEPEVTVAPNQAVVSAPVSMPTVETIQVEQDPNGLTYVVLKIEDALKVGVSIRMGRTAAESVAAATAKALEKNYIGSSISVNSLSVVRAGSTELVKMNLTTQRNGIQRDVTAEVEANDDLYESVAAGVISAYFAE
jgi:diguanylate cyclase (GGDEF)-like protein